MLVAPLLSKPLYKGVTASERAREREREGVCVWPGLTLLYSPAGPIGCLVTGREQDRDSPGQEPNARRSQCRSSARSSGIRYCAVLSGLSTTSRPPTATTSAVLWTTRAVSVASSAARAS